MSAVSEDEDRPLLAHLLELRTRLMRAAGVVLVLFLAAYPFREPLYTALAGPLIAVLPEGSSMIATQVATPFLIPLKVALVAAFFLSIPYLLYQLWAFVAPGLYRNERQLVWPLLFSSVVLFYAGMAFAYFLVFPLIFEFFAAATPVGVSMMTDIGEYLSFVMKLFFAFGAAFEVPIATILLVKTGATTRQSLAAKRPYVIVAAFTIGMLLTPPDVISQVLLAVPVWLLFELGIFLSRWFSPSVPAKE
ncbi:twin-arginine translocase subunit TatC [Spiribacter sp. C176]|uniref:Sec-independent protein translocase protein TatC n=1 Tax=Spiribacter salilacus TaxID=2664894 RepID=A0A6N7QT59_9GAMM|nr:twin-arginine translocase subunit TatC [Spiribacter salilacus]